jgi:hypothetical protein
MTIEEFLTWVGNRPFLPVAVFLAIPAIAWLTGLMHGRESSRRSPWKYVDSTLIYLACVPGVFAAVIVAYTLLFTRENLLGLDVFVTFVPIASMIATVEVIRRRADLDRLPGFDRLWGLIGLLTVSFVIALILDRLRVWLFFGGGMLSLVVIAAILYLVFRTTLRAARGTRRGSG